MRLRFHSNISKEDTAFVFENPPQKRSIIPFTGRPMSVWFPYQIFVIRYRKQHGRFWYGGISYNGLMVFHRNSPLRGLDDKLYNSPTDPGGLVCSDHRFDHMTCDTPEEVAGTVLDIWWNSTHYSGWGNKQVTWESLTEETVLDVDWGYSNLTIRSVLGLPGKSEQLAALGGNPKLVNQAVGELPSKFFKMI